MTLKIGDSVIVKPGILDPDFAISIEGWQGRIEEVFDIETVFIRWDSITLIEMGLDIIIRCENENLDWEVMTLKKEDIESSTPRDSGADVSRVVIQLQKKMVNDPRLIAEPDA